MLLFHLCILAGLIEPVRAASRSFAEEWRAEVSRFVGTRVPRGRLAEMLGTSRAFASMLVNHPDRQPNHDHAEKIAPHLGCSPEDVLKADLLGRFATLAELEAAIADERLGLRDVLIDLYRRRYPERVPLDTSFLARWERAVVAVLRERLPSRSHHKHYTGIDLSLLGVVIGKSTSSVYYRFRSGFYLTPAEVEALSRALSLRPETLLASELVWAFKSRADLERAIAGAAKPVREMMRVIYAARSCGFNLARVGADR